MLFLGFISGKRIRFPGKWAKTLKNPGSLTSTQDEPLVEAPDPSIPNNYVEFRPASNGTSPRPQNQHVQYVCVGEAIKNQ